MIYLLTIHTKDNAKGISRDIDLNILPSESAKLKSFALAYGVLTGGYAKITEMKAIVYSAEKPQLESSVINSVKIMYQTTQNRIFNVSLPYCKKSITRKDLKEFLMLYVDNFKTIVPNGIMYKDTI